MVSTLLEALALRGAQVGRRLRSLRRSPGESHPAALRASTVYREHRERSDFEVLQRALRRQLEWANDFSRVGDFPSAMTAMVDATAIDAELRVEDHETR